MNNNKKKTTKENKHRTRHTNENTNNKTTKKNKKKKQHTETNIQDEQQKFNTYEMNTTLEKEHKTKQPKHITTMSNRRNK